MSDVLQKVKQAQTVARYLATLSTEMKNAGLQAMADALREQRSVLIKENRKDVDAGKKNGITKALVDRLSLSEPRIEAMAEGLEIIIALNDPIAEVMDGWTRPNGLNIKKQRVAIGVIGIIYEARPNVTVDAAGLTLKSSNAVVLRGSSSAINSNKAIVKVLNDALESVGFPKNIISLIEDTSRETVKELVTSSGFVDLVIPRGGASLIKTVVQTATVPSIETGVGNCHVYIDRYADIEKAIPIVINSKLQRPSVCNATETLLIHKDIAEMVLPVILQGLAKHKVEVFGCERSMKFDASIKFAGDEEYAMEFLDYKIAIKIVDSLDEAIEHIYKFGSKHTECIVSEHYSSLNVFKQKVDASTIIVNASTRFTDGFEFGFGAEIGISTQKMHARGPMGLAELTTYKYIVEGNGQVR